MWSWRWLYNRRQWQRLVLPGESVSKLRYIMYQVCTVLSREQMEMSCQVLCQRLEAYFCNRLKPRTNVSKSSQSPFSDSSGVFSKQIKNALVTIKQLSFGHVFTLVSRGNMQNPFIIAPFLTTGMWDLDALWCTICAGYSLQTTLPTRESSVSQISSALACARSSMHASWFQDAITWA